MTKAKPRIFLGTTEIAGYYTGLYRGFRTLGVPVSWYFREPHKFGYGRRPIAERLLQKISARFQENRAENRFTSFFLSRVPALEAWLLRRIIKRHDVFIFGFMTSLDGILTGHAGLKDLKRLKAAGKTVICVFHGSEVRPFWLNGNFRTREPAPLVKRGVKSLKSLREIEKYADVIVSHPPMAVLQSRPYAQYLSVGIPMAQEKTELIKKTKQKSNTFKIVHAPSNPEAKGTERIKAVITRLRSEGYDIDLQLLINVPNSSVLQALRNADLLIDQIFSDTPMAHLATEAAIQACPSVVCGYDLKALRDIVPPEAWPPTIMGTPDELYDCVKWALDHEHERDAIGTAAQEFVYRRWRPEQVAKNFLRLANEGIPKEWEIDPKQQRFWGGYGMTLDQRDELVEKIVNQCGTKVMGLPEAIELPFPRP